MLDIRASYTRYRQIRDAESSNDAAFKDALRASDGRSLVVPAKLQNLFLLVRDQLGSLPSQNIVEFGSFRGGSALFMGFLLKTFHPGARLFALDTYAGMPPTDATRDLHKEGDFAQCDLEGFKAARHALDLNDTVEIVQGKIEDTFGTISSRLFGLAHIDVDIYSAVRFAQEAVWPSLTTGGYLVYDDAEYPTCLGATHAAVEFMTERRLLPEQVWPHWVVRKSV